MLVHARYSNGTLELLDKVELTEGEDITVDIFRGGKTLAEQIAIIRETAGAWKGLLDAEELKRDIYADRLIKTREDVKF